VQSFPGWAFATRAPQINLIHRSSWAMGTPIRLSMLESEFDSAAADDAFGTMQEIDRVLTVHDEKSVLMAMNSQPGVWTPGSQLRDVANAALQFGELSDGAMDVTILPAMRRFGFVPGSATDSDLIDFRQMEISEAGVRMKCEGTGADFGGIAKGYGVDQSVNALKRSGLSTALVDAGGDLYALGRPEAERPWKIGIRHPERENDLVATLEVENEAVATSGTYMQRRMVGGRDISHLMNPVTGQPVEHVISATMVSPDTMTSDALATATSVMDRAAGQQLIESLPGAEGFLIYADGTHYISKGLRIRLTIL